MKNEEIKIVVAHPGKQHSFRLATALHKAGMLQTYITTVYDSPACKSIHLIKKFLNKENQARAEGRKSYDLPDEKIACFCSLRGLFLLAILRLDKSRKVYNFLNRKLADSFGRKVARYAIRHKADAVICYDSNAVKCFEILKKKAPHIHRILDNAAANRYGLYEIYQAMDKQYGILENRAFFKDFLLHEDKALYYKNEALLSTHHIVASTFAANTITAIGINQSRVFTVPYGVDVSKITSKTNYAEDGALKVLFVGEISPQKGIFMLIEAAKALGDTAEFHLVGGGIEKLDADSRKFIKHHMTYHGYILQQQLFDLLAQCDVFVFPSLGDGFGFVVLEAMAAGLPVIASRNCCAQDLLIDGENGFLIDAGNTEQLVKKIRWLYENMDKLQGMSENAVKSAKDLTWENYERNLTTQLKEKIWGFTQ